ncbi:transcriptional regulator [Actinoplanes ianthinogenes]|uniref:Transcriptional regulator n=1 Tax=Actinoplanes ianthinogenes TaxID=122358 RepID=A0ABM7M756_9ACTN|nr:helix-turn-helix transcriptional regulator [Actinoplanes ianthinogenes]BCJ47430.1 transcriptional regulator [Actinoplanes ianthinogenes]GGR01733.1 transcriptional regulator [Actinoplanes ianthinogenes]
MERRSSPTVRNRELGALLKSYREARGLTAVQVAGDVGLSAAAISRLETASRSSPRTGVTQVRALCGYYGLDAQTTERLVQLAREGSKPGLWQRYDLESPTATYLDLESAAVSIDDFETAVFPGLLQTTPYAEAVIGTLRLHLSEDKRAQAVESRLRRQQILTAAENPLVFHAVVDEGVLHRIVGDRDVMRQQLRHVRDLATGVPTVTFQVLPFSAGASQALDGPFAVLSFAEKLLPTVIYTEGQLGQVFEDDPEVVARMEHAFSELAGLALDAEQSLRKIDEHIRALS